MEDMNKPIYRIINLEGFMSLLINRTERFVRPMDGWEDTYEGDILHLFDEEEGEKKIIDILYNDLVKHRTFDAIRNYVRLLHAKYLCYGQCWSMVEDSDAMWRIYSYGRKAIQLVSSGNAIFNTIVSGSNWEGKRPSIEKVKYDSENVSIRDRVPEYFALGMITDEPYFHKRSAFAHEEEVRVILNDINKYHDFISAWCGMLDVNYSFVNKEQDELPFGDKVFNAASKLKEDDGSILYLKKAPKELFVKINNLGEYITGVRVHPQAEAWYVDLIHKICEQYSINFFGKSDLYKTAY